MESKNLRFIQRVLNVIRIFNKIAMIVCIVSAALAAVMGLLALMPWAADVEKTIVKTFGIGDAVPHIWAARSLAAAVSLVFSAIITGLIDKYLVAERKDGTPFTMEGANMVKHLGIRCIVLSMVGVIVAATICAIAGANQVDAVYGSYAGVGIWLLIITPVLRYGAELREKAEKADKPE